MNQDNFNQENTNQEHSSQTNFNQTTSSTPASDKVKAFGDSLSQVIKEQASVIEQSASQSFEDLKNQFSSSSNTSADNNTTASNATDNTYSSAPMPAPLATVLNSEFKMSAIEMFAYTIALAVGTVCTLGIGYPWLACWQMRAMASATYINGRQLRFDGKEGELFVKWLKWMLFSIITLGLYSIWAVRNMTAWIVEHTHEA